MVLAELGQKITSAINMMSKAMVIDEDVIGKMTNSISLALLQSDVDIKLVASMKKKINKKLAQEVGGGLSKRKHVESVVVKEIFNLLDSGTKAFEPEKGKSNVIMFVGLQGAGKTTTCTKYAQYYKKKGWKTCLVCADTFRAGAFDQLKQNASKIKIPFYGSYTERDPVVVAEEGVSKFKEAGYEIIIVDTSGRHKQEDSLFEEMQEVAKATQPDETIFVMDSSIGQAARSQAEAFKASVDVGSVIITKLDGHAKGGGALSAVSATRAPIIFIGTGEHVEDFEAFNTNSFIKRLLGKGDLGGLLKIMDNKNFEETQRALNKKLKTGQDFTFRDMYSQFSSLMGMGSIGSVMSMIPGMGTNAMGAQQEQLSQARIKRFMNILDSMTQAELDGDDSLFTGVAGATRLLRVARGSGSPIMAVHDMLRTFIPFKKLFSQIQDMGPDAGQLGSLVGKKGDENIRKMASAFDPLTLQRVGGLDGLSKMMKQLAVAEKKGELDGFPGSRKSGKAKRAKAIEQVTAPERGGSDKKSNSKKGRKKKS